MASLQSQIAALQGQVTSLQTQLAAANATAASATAALTALGTEIGSSLGTTGFTIPGSTPAEQVQTLNAAINKLNPGQKKALFENLGGSKK